MPEPLVRLLIGAGIAALAVVLFWPRWGLASRWRQARRASERVLIEDALKHLYEFSLTGQPPSLESLAGALSSPLDRVARLLPVMQKHGLLDFEAGIIRLTPRGREYALHILRAHRLWERHLADETGYPEMEWHDQAEAIEHILTPSQADSLAERLGNPTYDPHGDPIPAATGEMAPIRGESLAQATEDHLRIVHIEDEPPAIYAQLVAEGLHPGMELRVIQRTPDRIVVWAADREHTLAPIVANNVTVMPIRKPSAPQVEHRKLSALDIGERARVLAISQATRGAERRRLMDLGLLPGTIIEASLRSPGGDPTAYTIRGALIALRREQADQIAITSSMELDA
ncbi:MAG TPA: iron dependent repressor, metal binding and dimerization domain protein [Anaerolineales bacterium]|nr:iron dependent repressor, metal binding and dimerization domain protein [Anaerolineales bacterium]